MNNPQLTRRRVLTGAALSVAITGCTRGGKSAPSPTLTTPAPQSEPPVPSRTPATCAPSFQFRAFQPVSYGNARAAEHRSGIRYLLPLTPNATGDAVAASYRDGVVVWDVASGAVRGVLAEAIWSSVLAWSPDGVELVTEDPDGLIRLDAVCGTSLGTLRGHRLYESKEGPGQRVIQAQFAPDGRRLYSIGGDRTLRAWSVDKGSKLAIDFLSDYPFALAVAPDSSAVVVAGHSHTTVHDPATLAQRSIFETPVHVWRFLSPTTLLGAADEKVVVSSLSGSETRVAFTVDGNVTDVASSPDGRFAVACTSYHGAWIAPLDGSAAPTPLERIDNSHGAISGACFTPDGKQIIVADQHAGIAAYDRSGTILRRFAQPEN
ncbi:WD40 repeat domain-containing protein [uncultured Tessaracoccus sp.]|uniref:WD40 repeat domain-containing protein n=1 Tax=uncultured Tessaracoccus sp. TaxID=905023 RepID=UPI00262A55FD|nr:WD40 repeat domain-containing protein [uncultured Tessaracoccus sp.]